MPNTWNAPGPGRKQCPECQVYIGVRTRVCACGHEFKKKAAQPRPQAKKPEASTEPQEKTEKTVRRTVIVAEPGRCPVELGRSDRASVREWVEALQQRVAPSILSVDALLLYARHFYAYGTEEYKEVSQILTGESSEPSPE